jgi:hypothetical protein
MVPVASETINRHRKLSPVSFRHRRGGAGDAGDNLGTQCNPGKANTFCVGTLGTVGTVLKIGVGKLVVNTPLSTMSKSVPTVPVVPAVLAVWLRAGECGEF